MSLNNRLSKICTDENIRQIDLVNIGLGSKQTISAILTGKQKPSLKFLELFLRNYKGIDVRWLFTGEIENIVEDSRVQYGFCRECLKKDGRIDQLERENASKDKRIEELLLKCKDLLTDEDKGKKAS
jgi:transcriptional regulator with XRE-family HTH domain